MEEEVPDDMEMDMEGEDMEGINDGMDNDMEAMDDEADDMEGMGGMDDAEDEEEDQDIQKEMEEISKEVAEEESPAKEMDDTITQTMNAENAQFDGDIQIIEDSSELSGSLKKRKLQPAKTQSASKPRNLNVPATAPKPKSQTMRDVPIALQKPRKIKEDPKKKAAREKME